MNLPLIKKHLSIACCGIDCGLCPTYYTDGPSKCPGCGGTDFSSKHPSCPILTCCLKNNGFETCADCIQYPCEKLKPWDKADSFVTHKVCLQNLNEIKKDGMRKFIVQQTDRIKILEILLSSFNDGGSKGFFCLATTLIPLEGLTNIIKETNHRIEEQNLSSEDIKSKSKIIKEIFIQYAKKENIELKLRKDSK